MTEILVLAGLFLVYALLASRLERMWVTAPMFFLLTGIAFGPSGTDLLPVTATNEPVKVLAEITLALLLFADASTISLRRARQDRGFPERLLFAGLPLTIVAGAALAWVAFPDLGWAGAALVGAMLAPTDAALGLAVVTNPAVPVRIRRMLNIESGLNDGLATPFVMLFLAMAVSEAGAGPKHFVLDAIAEIGIAVVVAAVVGLAGGWSLTRAHRRGWTSLQSEELAVTMLAFVAYAGSVAVGGNGFVAAFLGGLFFGARRHELIEEPMEFTETVSLFLSYLVWTMFGASVIGPVLTSGDVGWQVIAYAVASLTVVRMVPVAVALWGSRLRPDTVAFVGWFGPRGLASAVFTFLALDAFTEYGTSELATAVTAVAAWTILLSVVAHGLTATPLASAYGRRIQSAEPSIAERAEGPEPRIRRQRL